MTPRDTQENQTAVDAETGEFTPGVDPVAQAASDEVEELRAKYLRAVADIDNLRKRARREADMARRNARKELLGDMLEVLDNFERALAVPDAEQSPLYDGLQGVHMQLIEALARNGASTVEANGAAFDPHVHEAVAVEEREDVDDGIVMATLQQGFVMEDGDLLRPARVVVNRRG